MSRIISFFKIAIASACLSSPSLAEPVIVINKSLNMSSGNVALDSVFSASQLIDDDGDTIKIGILDYKEKGKKDLTDLFGKRSARLFEKRFKQLEFEGRGSYPEEFGSYPELVRWIMDTPNSLGVVDSEYASVLGLEVRKGRWK